jgi:dTDP-4-dehydrorhamnose 3,5-epimerase
MASGTETICAGHSDSARKGFQVRLPLGITDQYKADLYRRHTGRVPQRGVREDSEARMIYTEAGLRGVFTINIEPAMDERGFFPRNWCQGEFAAHGLRTQWVQYDISFDKQRCALRGRHRGGLPGVPILRPRICARSSRG